MPTEKPRVTFMVEEDILDQINAYRHSNQFRNQSQAILALLEKGLGIEEGTVANETEATTHEMQELVIPFRQLDAHGRQLVLTVLSLEHSRCQHPSAELDTLAAIEALSRPIGESPDQAAEEA